MACKQAIILAEQTMQEHVLPKLEALDHAPPHMAGQRVYGLKVSLGRSLRLAKVCAQHVKNLKGRDIDKSTILREFKATLNRGGRGGLER